ncbi:MAG: CbiX/SirB N-terminal domain-containing protein [Bdellovibrionales bacterium]|nr:CbiX/SirB N-terminal domain-containing protein [Ramlibacter sp.]
MACAIILFAHGSRDPLWRRPLEAVAQRIREQSPQTPVVCAYLELTEPALGTAAAALVNDGAEAIRIVPMFLGVGKHAREDLPVLFSELKASHPGVTFTLQPAVGEDGRLVHLLAEIALD